VKQPEKVLAISSKRSTMVNRTLRGMFRVIEAKTLRIEKARLEKQPEKKRLNVEMTLRIKDRKFSRALLNERGKERLSDHVKEGSGITKTQIAHNWGIYSFSGWPSTRTKIKNSKTKEEGFH